jgi:hypothetical protein
MQFTPLKTASWLGIPPFGTVLLLAAYLGFVLALEFVQNDIPGAQHYTALGVRAGWLAVAQVPLLVLLAGKNNLVGYITGSSYERLNVLHRWVARMLLLLATLHFGYQSFGWNQYGLQQLEWDTDTCPPTGIAAYAILLWMNLSTLAPIRQLSYEFFVVQHLITFFGFLIAIMMHLPSTALQSRVFIYIPIGFYLVDRLIRTLRYAYNNVRPGRATLTAMDGGVTIIRMQTKRIKSWAPGEFVLLSIPRLGLGQSHPATIASTPSSHGGDLLFILKCRQGFTKRLVNAASSETISSDQGAKEEATPTLKMHMALADGPYGGSHSDFAAFDSVLLIAGSTGVTFTLPILLDIAHRASSRKLPVRRLEFAWLVKSTTWTSWISDELHSAFSTLSRAGVEVAIKIFVTCDDLVTGPSEQAKLCGCDCDQSAGPCCCADSGESDDGRIESTGSNVSRDLSDTKNKVGITTTTTSPPSAPGESESRNNGMRSFATFHSGRPDLQVLLEELLDEAKGESGVAVCGPLGLKTSVRNAVAKTSDERAVHKGSGAQGIYLHVEGFSW